MNRTRRMGWSRIVVSVLVGIMLFAHVAVAATGGGAGRKPNVILIMTDDQGYGDIGALGNTKIHTPNMDRLYTQSVRLTDFHVDPTCSPTRSALMTGRYSTRTGVWHTIMGRSIMRSSETTMAEMFRDAGYRTAMFGKWHLGDNYPCRPGDQGFEEAFYNGGGGVSQTPDYWGNDYFDDTYYRNGKPEKVDGYCTDVWFRNALSFIDKHRDEPFFVYLPTNAAHGPFNVSEQYSGPYVRDGVPQPMANFYGMITNIDENLGKMMDRLRDWGLEENTVLIFMTDNGTAAGMRGNEEWKGFNAQMRGTKGSAYDGGHRVPCFIRWPGGRIGGGWDVNAISAHIDLLPTLADLCGIEPPTALPIDGRSLAPLLRGLKIAWPPRTLFVHSQRIEYPQKWKTSAVMTSKWRLINGKELYDIEADPGEATDVSAQHDDVVTSLRQQYETWWRSLEPGFDDYVRIVIGSDHDNPARITCHDWHGQKVPWNQPAIRNGLVANGFWALDVDQPGRYRFTLRRWPVQQEGPIEATSARLKVGDIDVTQTVKPADTSATFEVNLAKGPTKMQTWLTMPGGQTRGAYFVYVERLK